MTRLQLPLFWSPCLPSCPTSLSPVMPPSSLLIITICLFPSPHLKILENFSTVFRMKFKMYQFLQSLPLGPPCTIPHLYPFPAPTLTGLSALNRLLSFRFTAPAQNFALSRMFFSTLFFYYSLSPTISFLECRPSVDRDGIICSSLCQVLCSLLCRHTSDTLLTFP